MTLLLDASVVVPLLVPQANSVIATIWLADKTVGFALTDFIAGEIASAISRLVRMNEITRDAGVERLHSFDTYRISATRRILIDSDDVLAAVEIVRRFDLKLRMPDALHVGMCRRHGLSLITFDQRLADAAPLLGVESFVPA